MPITSERETAGRAWTPGREAITPMRDHVARFWQCVESERVRLLVEMRKEVGHDTGKPSIYYDSSSFPDEVAKALAAERARNRATIEALVGALVLQGVHLDVIAVADEIALDCPRWAEFLLRLKERAQSVNDAARSALLLARGSAGNE